MSMDRCFRCEASVDTDNCTCEYVGEACVCERCLSKIVTSNVCPPIPIRSFDWCAYFDGEEENGGYGYGPTEGEAIADLLEARAA